MSGGSANGSWEPTTLSEIAWVVRGRVNPQEQPELPFIGMEGVEAHTMRLLATVPAADMKSASVHFQPGDVLYGRLRPYLNKVISPEFEGLASAEFIPLTMPEGVAHKFIQYRINAADFVSYASRLDEGDRPRVDYDQIGAFSLDLPPSREQHRIVEAIESYLTRLDDAVATLERVQRNLKRYRASVLKAAVKGRLVPTEAELARAVGCDYEPASVLMERILAERRRRWEDGELAKMSAKGKVPKEDGWKANYVEPSSINPAELPALPAGWKWTSAAEACTAVVSGSTPDAARLFSLEGPIPFIKVYNLTLNGELDFSVKPTFIEKSTHEGQLNRSRITPGDVLTNIVGPPLGQVSVVPSTHPEWNINQAIAAFRPSDAVTSGWLRVILMSEHAQRWLVQTAKTTTSQVNLAISNCRRLPVPIPPRGEQTRIVAEVDRLISVAADCDAVVSRELGRLRRLRQSILKWAFEGRLVDQDPTDEPASALLERIRAERAADDGEGPKRFGRQGARRRAAGRTQPG